MLTKQAALGGAAVLTAAGGAVWAVVSAKRRRRLGLAPLAPGAKLPTRAPSPWDTAADKKRLAQYFFTVRSKQVRDLIPRGAPLPKHIYPYAEYMTRRAGKPVTNRDIVKAYLLTLSSIRRRAITPSAVRERWPTFKTPKGAKRVRPEDAFGQLLRTSIGKRYLDAAERGELDREAADKMATAFGVFGFPNVMRKQLALAPKIARRGDVVRRRLKGSRKGWYKFVQEQNLPGIRMGKAGFIAALLGRGDIATADTRQTNFWTCPPKSWNIKKRACAFPLYEQKVKGEEKWIPGQFAPETLIKPDYLEILNRRMRGLNIKMPARYEPYREHLTHHAFWDKIEGTKTTHQALIDAMELAGKVKT